MTAGLPVDARGRLAADIALSVCKARPKQINAQSVNAILQALPPEAIIIADQQDAFRQMKLH